MSGTTNQPACLLHARNLSKRTAARWLLQQVDCRLEEGQRVVLRGPSGSGKTLLLRSLALLEPEVQGQVLWQGRPVRPDQVPRFRSQVMYLPQQALLVPGTVWENLLLPLRFAVHRHRQVGRQEVQALLGRFGLRESFLEQEASRLSGGEGQVVALIRAFLLQPIVLLLDEPTAAMDTATAAAAVELVRCWWEQGAGRRAYVWVTHDPHLARKVGEHFWQMSSGRLETIQATDGSLPGTVPDHDAIH